MFELEERRERGREGGRRWDRQGMKAPDGREGRRQGRSLLWLKVI